MSEHIEGPFDNQLTRIWLVPNRSPPCTERTPKNILYIHTQKVDKTKHKSGFEGSFLWDAEAAILQVYGDRETISEKPIGMLCCALFYLSFADCKLLACV